MFITGAFASYFLREVFTAALGLLPFCSWWSVSLVGASPCPGVGADAGVNSPLDPVPLDSAPSFRSIEVVPVTVAQKLGCGLWASTLGWVVAPCARFHRHLTHPGSPGAWTGLSSARTSRWHVPLIGTCLSLARSDCVALPGAAPPWRGLPAARVPLRGS